MQASPKATGRQLFGYLCMTTISQLKGKVRFDWHADGLVCEITLHA
jgi:hypothetical protein